MEEQNSPEHQPGTEIKPGSAPLAEQSGQQTVESPKPKNSKKLPIIALLVILALGAGAAAWWFFLKEDSATTQTPTQQTQDSTEESHGTPNNIVYAKKGSGELYSSLAWKKIGEDTETIAKEFNKDDHVTQVSAWQNKVFATVSTTSGDQIWYSTDEGQTYTLAFEGTPPEDSDSFGDQITGTIFSSDGEGLVIGIITASGVHKAVYEPLATGDSRDLFTTNDPILPKAHDVENEKVYFLKNECWNCDGGRVNEVFTYDLKNKAETSWENPNNLLLDITINNDITKVLVTTGVQNPDGPGLIYPFGIHELELASNGLTEILAEPDSFVEAAYSLDNQTYYAVEGKLTMVGSSTPSYETGDTISEVLFVHDDDIITVTSSGSSSQKVVHFNKSSQASATLFEVSNDSIRAAVTYSL